MSRGSEITCPNCKINEKIIESQNAIILLLEKYQKPIPKAVQKKEGVEIKFRGRKTTYIITEQDR